MNAELRSYSDLEFIAANTLIERFTNEYKSDLPRDLRQRASKMLGLYQSVLSPESYNQFLSYVLLDQQKREYIVFVEKGNVRSELITMHHYSEDLSLCIPDFSRNYEGSYSCSHLIQNLTNEGHIAFSQSPASVLPYYLTKEVQQTGHFNTPDHLVIVDLCSAPGNKTFNMIHLPNVSSVTAIMNDYQSSRLGRVHERLREFGFVRIDQTYKRRLPDGRDITIVLTAENAANQTAIQRVIDQYAGTSPHVVIADVPCSSDGRIAHDAQVLRYPNPPKDRDIQLSTAILKTALQIVRPGNEGIVAYSTCSIQPKLNEMVVSDAVEDQSVVVLPHRNIAGLHVSPPMWGDIQRSVEPEGVRVYPHQPLTKDAEQTWATGFYCVLMQKT